MPVDVEEIFSEGGERLIHLLDYAVRAVQTDVLFLFLVQEYRQAPATPRAVALYEIFCAPQSPARVNATELLPSASQQLAVAMRPLQVSLAQIEAAWRDGVAAPPPFLPPKFLFDALASRLQAESEGLRRVREDYRPELPPLANLPGEHMSAGQRHFVEKVWQPRLRPWLVNAGFRRVGSIA